MVQTCFLRTEIPYSIGSQGPKREIGRERDVLVWQFIDRMYRFYLLIVVFVCLSMYLTIYLFIYIYISIVYLFYLSTYLFLNLYHC